VPRLVLGLVFLLAAAAAQAVPFWGAKESQPAGTDPAALKPGQFVWTPDAAPAGPIVVAVSLEEQRAYVYRNGIGIGVSTVSSGKPGHGTPTGVFTVLQKDKDHHSKTYNDAAMPFTERLTWDGVALHAGGLPGFPSSHGCVHLPSAFAAKLFEVSSMGMVVVIADAHSGPADVRHPLDLAPVDPKSGAEIDTPRLAGGQQDRWTPDASPAGPVSVLLSVADRRVFVFRNGVEIGRARIDVRDPDKPFGTHAYVRLDDTRWIAVALPGHEAERGLPLDPEAVHRVTLPPDFLAHVRGVLGSGSTLVVTDAAVLPETTGPQLTLVSSDPPAEAPPKTN
jgi:hypothetical protein